MADLRAGRLSATMGEPSNEALAILEAALCDCSDHGRPNCHAVECPAGAALYACRKLDLDGPLLARERLTALVAIHEDECPECPVLKKWKSDDATNDTEESSGAG